MTHAKKLICRLVSTLLSIVSLSLHAQDRNYIDEVLGNAENEVKGWQHFEENVLKNKWINDGHELIKVRGMDENGKSANFLFFVLTQEIKWVCGSNTHIISGHREIDFATRLNEESGLSRLAQFDFRTKLISVGMASIEGNSVEEYDRAKSRAKTINSWLKSKIPETDRELLILNLGKYKGHIENQEVTNINGHRI